MLNLGVGLTSTPILLTRLQSSGPTPAVELAWGTSFLVWGAGNYLVWG
jgi:hypothetical protein